MPRKRGYLSNQVINKAYVVKISQKSNTINKIYKYLYTSAPFQVGADYILSIINTNNTNHRLVDELHTF